MYSISYNVKGRLAFTRYVKLQGNYFKSSFGSAFMHVLNTIILGDCSNAVLADLFQKSHYSWYYIFEGKFSCRLDN